MAITVNIKRAKEMIISVIKAGLVAFLKGSPGGGKSAIINQIAAEYNLKVIDFRLSQCDPTDMLGFPSIDKENGKAHYVPMDTFPLEGDPLPKGYDGWLLFFDEINGGDRGTQKACYKTLYDKMVGNRKIHPKVAMVCAGNLDTDNALVEEMSTALQSRLIHLELAICHESWVEWAEANGVDYRITSYIKFAPDKLYTFSPDHTDNTYASPRTWVFASQLLKYTDADSSNALPLLAGTISQGVASEFLGFLKIYKDLHTIQDILARPEALLIPDEPSTLFALTGLLANNAKESNLDTLIIFIKRLPIEFQVVCLRETVRRDKQLLDHPAIQAWIASNATDLF